MRVNSQLLGTWLMNVWRARIQGKTLLEPMGVTWHATNRCNLRCSFCDDGKGNRYPDLGGAAMTTREVKRVLSLAREKVNLLYITGGEPLVRPDLAEIVRWAKEDARYHHIGMVTNGVLLHRNEALLHHVDDLAISLHMIDEERGDRVLGSVGATRRVTDAVKRYSALKRELGYDLNVSCVARPGKIQDARDVMSFCFENDVPFSVMPQSVTPYPHPGLVGDPEYVAFMDEVIARKRQGSPVWGSYAYLKSVRDFEKFTCHPTTVPRIFPNGDLGYPCSPLDSVAGNLIDAGSFDEVMAEGVAAHGPIPRCDTRCFASCYIETSNTIEYPGTLAWELFDIRAKVNRLVARVLPPVASGRRPARAAGSPPPAPLTARSPAGRRLRRAG